MVALLLEHPGVREGLRDVDAELRQDLLVALGERAHLVAQQIERAEHAVLVAKRDGELRVHA